MLAKARLAALNSASSCRSCGRIQSAPWPLDIPTSTYATDLSCSELGLPLQFSLRLVAEIVRETTVADHCREAVSVGAGGR